MKKNLLLLCGVFLVILFGFLSWKQINTKPNLPLGIPDGAVKIPLNHLKSQKNISKKLSDLDSKCDTQTLQVTPGLRNKDEKGKSSLMTDTIVDSKGNRAVKFVYKKAPNAKFCYAIWSTNNKYDWSSTLLDHGGVAYITSADIQKFDDVQSFTVAYRK